jgi:hypothetical protein
LGEVVAVEYFVCHPTQDFRSLFSAEHDLCLHLDFFKLQRLNTAAEVTPNSPKGGRKRAIPKECLDQLNKADRLES